MHEIDLGDELKIKVKYKGAEYEMREPTVEEIDGYRSKMEGESGAKMLVEFLSELGMPKEVVSKMGMSRARALVDGLMETLTKKK